MNALVLYRYKKRDPKKEINALLEAAAEAAAGLPCILNHRRSWKGAKASHAGNE